MKLRTRLFVSIGIVFLLVFIASVWMENFVTRKRLNRAASSLEQQIIDQENDKRVSIEHFLAEQLAEVVIQLSADKYRVEWYPPLKQSFLIPSSHWLAPSTLLASNKVLSFVQNDQSVVLVGEKTLKDVLFTKSPSGLVWTEIEGKQYVAIALTAAELVLESQSISQVKPQEFVSFFLLFTPDQIKQFDPQGAQLELLSLSINPLAPILQWIPEASSDSFRAAIINHLSTAKKLLENRREKTPPLQNIPPAISSLSSLYEQITMIWGLSAVNTGGGLTPPVGIAREDTLGSKGVLRDQIFYTADLFDQEWSPHEKISVTGSSVLDRYFFSSQVDLGEGKTLRFGIDASKILNELCTSLHRTALFISDNKVIAALDPDGKSVKNQGWKNVPIPELVSKDNGFLTVGEENYFYMHMRPIPNADFHYLVFIPKEQAFAFISSVKADTTALISNLSLQMRLISLSSLVVILLLVRHIARHVTRPIELISSSTQQVARGNWKEAQLPKLASGNKRDEVTQLYNSFRNMVKELEEKERVRTVLNKVVSPEVAQEILTHGVDLGGEVKEVTVLFGDIRGFTHLTQNMPPQQVIELLNHCMTDVAEVIDRHQGVIDKFVGDEVMALFGAFIPKPDSTLQAIRAGIGIMKALEKWNKERLVEGMTPILMGIGIDRGPVVAGNMGAKDRLNYTVLGSHVNLASRLCSQAAPGSLLISEAVYQYGNIKEEIACEPLGEVELKGFSEKIRLYQVKIDA